MTARELIAILEQDPDAEVFAHSSELGATEISAVHVAEDNRFYLLEK
jgi:hypothetical protein